MRYPIAAAALLASLALVQLPASAHDMKVSVRSGHEVRTCEDLEVTFDDRPAVTAVDRLTAPGSQKLTVHASRNGGVYAFGGARQDFAISACKAAAPASAGGSASSLEQVRASLNGGTRTQNGPIAFEGGSGTIDLEAQNGPVAVRLAGSKWADGSLSARAQNGPVKLEVPRGFASGVRVHSSQHSPWKCQGCDDGRRIWGNSSRSVEFGSGPVAVTLSTVKWPVAVDMSK